MNRYKLERPDVQRPEDNWVLDSREGKSDGHRLYASLLDLQRIGMQ